MTRSQLESIYECTDTNWDQVGGQDAPIEVFLPQVGSETRTLWLTALGGGVTPITPGACVSDLATEPDPDGTLAENEGINPALDSPEAIFPYSVSDYIARARDRTCSAATKPACSASTKSTAWRRPNHGR